MNVSRALSLKGYRYGVLILSGALLIFGILVRFSFPVFFTQTAEAAAPTVFPLVTKLALSSTTLANVDQDLFKFQLSSTSTQGPLPIAVKQVAFKFTKSSSVSLSNFRLRRGVVDISPGSIKILCVNVCTSNGTNLDMTAGTIPLGVTSGIVIVSFPSSVEEAITGSGSIYSLHATVAGAQGGTSVTFSLAGGVNMATSGSIANNAFFSGYYAGSDVYHVDRDVVADGLPDFVGLFIWSDLQGVPHSVQLGTQGGSHDWYSDTYIAPAQKTQTLSL